ncbi:MAG: phosphate ABC transporter substrate-binding protein PstS [Candidatus Eremiobacteraeota bacterium]|nr:phosphate ABC transporter substrate-binding protein PstS [Candidatus Eremiobacteraeota bacterium]
MKTLAVAVLALQITGAGATFPYPFYSKAFSEYSAKHPDVTIAYQAVGSANGIASFTSKSVDFGASDVPMNDDELKRAESGGGRVIEFPTTLGGVAITYNLTSLRPGIKLSRAVLADIYLGKITNWNDPKIAALNLDTPVPLPNLPIVVVHRADGSGTTYHFTDFLSHVSPAWKTRVGAAKSVHWPTANAVAGTGNDGVAQAVGRTVGAIGYVELTYALTNNLSQVTLQNRAGTWLTCTPHGIEVAAETRPAISPNDFSIVDTGAPDAWPISAFSWAMVYQSPADKARAKATKEMLLWLVGEAQPIAGALHYVPLPSNIVRYSTAQISRM